MKKESKILTWIFISFVIAKAIISYFIPSSRTLADDYNYLKMSESFFYDFSFKVHGFFTGQFHPLYPFMISIGQIFKDNNLVYLSIKIINSILSSLIIFPAYYLSKEFLSEKKSLFISILISLLPSSFALTSYIMAENLFYSLFLFSLYFIYKAFNERKLKYHILTGGFIGLAYLTKINGAILIALLILLIVFDVFNKKFDKKSLLSILIILLIILPLLLSQFGIFKVYLAKFGLIEDIYLPLQETKLTERSFVFSQFFMLFFAYFGFIISGSGFIFLPSTILSFKIKTAELNLFRKISIFIIILTLIVVANNNARIIRDFIFKNEVFKFGGDILGRYVDPIIPVVMILGFIGIEHYLKNKNELNLFLSKKRIAIFVVIGFLLIPISIYFAFNNFFPFNNVSLTIFGVVNYFIDLILKWEILHFILILIIFISAVLIGYFALKKFDYKKIISFLLIIFILNLVITLGVINYASRTSWYYNSEQRQLALYLNSIDKERSNILIDEKSYGDLGGEIYDPNVLWAGTNESKYTILGYWLNDNLIIGNINNLENVNYVISTYKLNLEKIYETRNKIYLYKVN